MVEFEQYGKYFKRDEPADQSAVSTSQPQAWEAASHESWTAPLPRLTTPVGENLYLPTAKAPEYHRPHADIEPLKHSEPAPVCQNQSSATKFDMVFGTAMIAGVVSGFTSRSAFVGGATGFLSVIVADKLKEYLEQGKTTPEDAKK